MFSKRWNHAAAALIAGMALLAAPAVQAAGWYRARTAHFVMYSDGDPKGLRALAIKAELFNALLSKRYSTQIDPDTPPIDIYLLSGEDSVSKLAGAKNRFLRGFYASRPEGSFIVSNRSMPSGPLALESDTLLFHEYTHYFMLHNFVAAYPAWFTEGFAELFSESDFPAKGGYSFGGIATHRAYALIASGQTAPILQILDGSAFRGSPQLVDYAYGRSWLLTHMLMIGDQRPGQLDTYLRLFREGKSADEAAKEAFGDLAQLDKDLNKYMNGRMTFLKSNTPLPQPPEPAIEQLDPVTSQVMPLRILRRIDRRAAEAAEALARIAEANPRSAAAWYELARAADAAAQQTEDGQKAQEWRRRAADALDRTLAIEPGHGRALLYNAADRADHLRDIGNADPAQWKQVRAMLSKANAADNNDPLVLYDWYRSFRMQGVDAPQLGRDALSRAFQLAPDVQEIRIAYAQDLAEHEQYDDARAVIQPIVFDPHNPGIGASLLNSLDATRNRNEERKKREAERAAAAAARTTAPSPPPAKRRPN